MTHLIPSPKALRCGLAVPILLLLVSRLPAEKYAFLVGVQQYQGTELRSLEYAKSDVDDLAKVLTEVGYKAANIVVLTEERGPEERPDAANIMRRLKELLVGVRTEDTLLAGFSGHGVQFMGKEESYFCPAGADLNRLDTLLRLDLLYETLAANPSGLKVLLVDACRNDPQQGKSTATPAQSITRPPDPRGGIASLYSCTAGQQSYEHKALKHGVFFHYVIEGLRGKADSSTAEMLADGSVDLPELEKYVVEQVPAYVRDHRLGEQIPERHGKTRGLVYLSLPRKVAVQPPESTRAPFNVALAHQHQAQWANYLGTAVVFKNVLGMEFVLIPPGKFRMGSDMSASGLEDRFKRDARLFTPEFPQHEVEITNPFYLGKHEVTVGQFRAFVEDGLGYKTDAERSGGGIGLNPANEHLERIPTNTWNSPGFVQDDSHPVVHVSWNDAQAFCQWLSKKTGSTYRLPTEAMWEYACRAGTETMYSNGNSDVTLPMVANLADQSSRLTWAKELEDGFARTSPVGKLEPNAFRAFDMHGNVYEWCLDLFYGYPGTPLLRSTKRVTRGGSWESLPEMVRSSVRHVKSPDWCCDATGFRVVLVPRTRANP